MSVRKTALLALFTTLSLAIFAIESAVPPLVPIPGIKLGLANIITLILLRHFSARDALIVLISRILLSAFLFGQALSLLYSLMGGLCSLLDKTLWGGSLDYLQVPGKCTFDLKDLYLAAGLACLAPSCLAPESGERASDL